MRTVARKHKGATLLLILLLFSTSAQAQSELVNNGDFETGTYAGWTTMYTGNEIYCYVGWEIEPGFTNCIFPYFDRLAGNYSAVNDFDGSISQFYMYQDITIPSGAIANFSFIYRIQYFNDPTFPWTLPRTFDVQVRDPGTDAVLGTLHAFVTNIPADCGVAVCSGSGGPVDNNTKFDTGLVSVGPVDMSPWAGQTVRLYFLEDIPEYMTGGSVIVMDNISVISTLGINVSETGGSTDITEGGATDSFSLTLDQPPTDTVTINIVPDAQCTVDVNPVVFALGDAGPINVTVTAVNDAVVEGPHSCTIQFGAAVSTDGNFNGVNPDDVVANVTDFNSPGGGGGNGGGSSSSGSSSVNVGPAVPLCNDLNGTTNSIVRAALPGGVYGVHCRVIAENSSFIRTPAELGVQSVLDRGVIQAVDIFSPSGVSVAGATICLQGTGNLVFLDATQAPRVPQNLPVSIQNGYSCTTIPALGTLALVRG